MKYYLQHIQTHDFLRAFSRIDKGAFAIVAIFILILPISTPRIALTDEVQYYAYLRSFYFDRDLDFRNEYQHFADIGLANGDPAIRNALLATDANNPNPETGLLRNVAPVGSSIMWAPGFILADVGVRIANLMGGSIPADGYSKPYINAACYMSALYSLLGLLLVYRLAMRFSDQDTFAAAAATITVWLASPLLFYTYIAMPWSHATGFFLFALFLNLWLPGPSQDLVESDVRRPLRAWLTLGVIGGLMVMTREQLGLLLIMPAALSLIAYVNLAARRRWREAGRFLLNHTAFLAALALTVTPQLLAYSILNGHVGPSSTVGQKLNWLSPNFFNTLIDPAHGAFLWSPVLALGLIGMLWLGRSNPLLAALLLLGFVGQTYINGAFGSTWHLSRAFGFRRLIECTPLFVLGLAALTHALRAKIAAPYLIAAAALLVYWNIGLIAQWTIIRPQELRPGLVWHDMLYYQFYEVPRQVGSKLYQIVFDRCQFLRNC